MRVLLCAWWRCHEWFKTHLRDVFSSGKTPMFISQSIMKKLFLENLENLLHLAVFAVFLSYFPECKLRLNLRPFMFLFLGWGSVEKSNQHSQKIISVLNDFLRMLVWLLSTANPRIKPWSEKVELLSVYRGFPSLSKVNRKWKWEFSIEAKSIEKVNFHWKRHFMCLYTISILQKIITMPHLRSHPKGMLLTLPTNEI